MKNNAFSPALFIVLIALVLSGCASSMEVPFSVNPDVGSLEYVALAAPDEAIVPASSPGSLFLSRDFFVVGSFDEARVTSRLFANNPDYDIVIAGLEDVDYSLSFAVVAWHGAANDTRFRIEIKRIIRQGQTLRVMVEAYNRCNRFPTILLSCPYTPESTYPVQIATVDYDNLPVPDFFTIEFRVNGTLEKTIIRRLPPLETTN